MTPNRPSRAEQVSLAAAGVLWLLVHGYGARQILAAGGHLGLAALMIALPILIAVIWWLGVRRTAAWLTRQQDSPAAAYALDYGLLILAVVLGTAAVWMGQTHTRALRAARQALTTTAPAGTLPTLSGPNAIHIWCLLGLAGALALLTVLTLGVALSHRAQPTDPNATEST